MYDVLGHLVCEEKKLVYSSFKIHYLVKIVFMCFIYFVKREAQA